MTFLYSNNELSEKETKFKNNATYYRKKKSGENQDGGVGRHTAPPCTTRTDRKLNGKESDTKEIKK